MDALLGRPASAGEADFKSGVRNGCECSCDTYPKQNLVVILTKFSFYPADYAKGKQQISQLKELQGAVLYAIYPETRNYYPLIASTVAQGIDSKLKGDYSVSVYIDGFPPKQLQQVRKQLKKHRVHYHKIKGVRKEESDEFIRLADAIVGLISHWKQGREYAQSLFERLRKQGIAAEIKKTGLS